MNDMINIHSVLSILIVPLAIVLVGFVIWDVRHAGSAKRAARLKQRAHERGRDDLLKKK